MGSRSLWYALALLPFDMTLLTPSEEQRGGEAVPENPTANPVRAKFILLSLMISH